MDVITTELPLGEFGRVEPLWAALVRHNAQSSTHFASYFGTFTFEVRLSFLQEKAARGQTIRTFVLGGDDPFGFCTISYCARDKSGELEMLYVSPNQRGNGYGKALMERALEVFRQERITALSLSVAAGNQHAMDFYQRFGFQPFTVHMLRQS